jgi:hypothetical protein
MIMGFLAADMKNPAAFRERGGIVDPGGAGQAGRHRPEARVIIAMDIMGAAHGFAPAARPVAGLEVKSAWRMRAPEGRGEP